MELRRHLRLGAELGISVTAISALILAGCGGGGGAGAAAPGGSVAAALVTPMKGQFCSSASVTVLDKNNLVIGTGSVSASGVVSVGNISSSAPAPYVVKVGAGATPSCYYDEAAASNVTIPANTTALHSVVPSYAALTSASGLAVTPLTEMAYQYLNAAGTLAVVANVTAANNAVASGFGLTDILQTPTLIGPATAPLSNSTSQANRYALAIAALTQTAAASATGGQTSLEALLAQMPTFIASGVPATTYANAYTNFTSGASSVLATPAAASATAPTGSLDSLINGGPLVITGFSPASGVVGTTVTISGTHLGNFIPAPMVKFGSTVATVSSATATSIVATVPAGLAIGNSTITLSNFDGTGVVTVGTFNVTAGVGAATFPNEAITLPAMDLNAITNPTMAATDVSSMVGTYTGIKSAYQTNVDTSLVVDYSTATTTNSCQLTFAANRTLTLTDGTHTFTQTANDFWTHSLTGETNTGFYSAGAQSLGVGATGITMQIGRGKLIAVTAQVFTAAPAVMSEKLTCWMPINRAVGTAGSNMTTGTYYDNASDLPATAPGTYTSPLLVALGAAAPAGATCQLVVAANGNMTFTTTGLATNANMTVQIAGDYDDRVSYTDATTWSYTARDISDQISGAYNSIQIQKVAGTLMMTISSGTVRPLTAASYTCM